MIYFDDKWMCEDCGATYDSYENECPVCSGYVVKAERCTTRGCREYMVIGDFCCSECKQDAIKTLSVALGQLTSHQVKFLDSVTDGEPLMKFWRNH